MLIIIEISICLFNLVMAFTNYEKGNYKTSMSSMFVAGFAFALAMVMAFDKL